MKNRKIVPAFFQVYENDCLRDYLEHMAQKGWKLSSVGSIFLHFEACKPHRILCGNNGKAQCLCL